MQIIDNGKFKKLIADEGKKIFSPYTNSYHDYVLLGKNQEENKFKEVNDPQPIYEEEQEKQITNKIINENPKSASNDAFSELATLANIIINK